MSEHVERAEVEAVLAARAELGPSYDAELVDAFAERIERAVDVRLAQRAPAVPAAQLVREQAHRQWVLGIVSCGVGIPITAITAAGSEGSMGKLLVAWGGIVGVNAAHALAGWFRRGAA